MIERRTAATSKRIGIYGGSFDPIHHGHLILARDAREQLGLEKMIFVPAASSPHKMHEQPTPAALRLLMTRAAIRGDTGFEVHDFEALRPAPSFTIETAEQLAAREHDAELFYLIGEDNVEDLPTWKRFEDLNRLVKFVVMRRSGNNSTHSYPVIERHIDISSSDIRDRVAQGLTIQYLVPPAVEEIIRRNNLYMESDK